MIEYLAPNGKAWSPYTGCLHGKDICATSDKCWARSMSARFKQICGGDFQPRFHLERLDQPLHWRKPRRVAVCFMGDLFGKWNDQEEAVLDIVDTVTRCPQHTFLFLTKRPEALASFNPWPTNAWVGCTITGAETSERQAAMLEALRAVEGAKVRWVSYEPMLAELPIPTFENWVDWVVFGFQSGPGAFKLTPKAVRRQVYATAFLGIPVWEKNNLARYLKRSLVQELPG